eukprot:scaffold251429_cov32-Tisochrysis_lutea.AAC.2
MGASTSTISPGVRPRVVTSPRPPPTATDRNSCTGPSSTGGCSGQTRLWGGGGGHCAGGSGTEMS